MWHQSRRISPIFGEPTLSWEYLPYHLNLKEEEALLQYNSGKCPYELRKLLFTDKLLVKKIRKRFQFFRARRKTYKILNSDEIGIFYMKQMYDYFSHIRCKKFPINYHIYGEPERKLLLAFTGSPGIFGAGGEISAHLIKSHSTKIHLGNVLQESNICDPIFNLLDFKGQIGFSIQGPDEGNCWGIATNAEFNIYQHVSLSNDENMSVIGKLYRNGRTGNSNEKFKWIIEFPRDLDPATKVMVLSAAFLLESQFYA